MSNKVLNFDRPLKGFDGKPEGSDLKLGQLLARVLGSEDSNDKLDFVKIAGWVKLLWNGEDLSLDKSDLEKLKGIIEKTKGLNVWLKAQAFEVLEEEGHVPPRKHPKGPDTK